VRQAVSSPLLETTIEGAKSVILNITGGKDLTISEVNEAATLVQGIIDGSANIIFGATIDNTMADEVKITVIATGFVAGGESVEAPRIAVEIPVARPIAKAVEQQVQKAPQVEESFVQESMFDNQEDKNVDELSKIEEQLMSEPETKKNKELPAFMRKLFKKKQ
jgi:cell division GTPase FtsZ